MPWRGPARHRTGGAVLQVVGVGHDRHRPLPVLVDRLHARLPPDIWGLPHRLCHDTVGLSDRCPDVDDDVLLRWSRDGGDGLTSCVLVGGGRGRRGLRGAVRRGTRRPGPVDGRDGPGSLPSCSADAVSYSVGLVVQGTWSPKTSLPLALCDVGVLVAAAACWWETALLVELTYFWGLAGTLQAVITPDLNVGFPHLVFFQYVVGHVGIVVAALFLVVGWASSPGGGRCHGSSPSPSATARGRARRRADGSQLHVSAAHHPGNGPCCGSWVRGPGTSPAPWAWRWFSSPCSTCPSGLAVGTSTFGRSPPRARLSRRSSPARGRRHRGSSARTARAVRDGGSGPLRLGR